MNHFVGRLPRMAGPHSLISDAGPIDAETVDPATISSTRQPTPGLRKVPPYWYPYSTRAKQRWWGREILEVVSTEFRDRSMEFYVSDFDNDREDGIDKQLFSAMRWSPELPR